MVNEIYTHKIKMFDLDILFEFLSDEDKKTFIVWTTVNIIDVQGHELIQAKFSSMHPYYSKVKEIPFEEYIMKLKQKEREIKLNKLLQN